MPIAALIAVIYRYVRDELDGRSPQVAPDGTEARVEGDDDGAALTRERVAAPGDPTVGGAAVARDDESPRSSG